MEKGLIILDGTTFFFSGFDGNVTADDPDRGYFFEDVRHLSRWELKLRERSLTVLTSRAVDYYSARIVLVAEDDPSGLSVRRDRFVTEGVHEDVVVRNHKDERQEIELELDFGSDFADVMQVNGDEPYEGATWNEAAGRAATLWFERDGYRRGTIVRFSKQPTGLDGGRAIFRRTLAPGEEWKTCVDVVAIRDGKEEGALLRCDSFGTDEPEMPLTLQEWLDQAPEIDTAWDALRRTYRHALTDLASLRIRPRSDLRHAMPAGGIPWFMCVFGRDAILAAYEALPFQPTLAEATLQELAAIQARDYDDFRDAEPGKIAHELRSGALAKLGVVPHTPYYGTHDATQLFLILLDEYHRWTGDDGLALRLEENARKALAWIEGPADLDGDGYLEYRSRSPKGLSSHCWKDSDDSIQFADGTIAEAPIATCEIQGYAYDARLRTARLAHEVCKDEDLAKRLERDAADLKERFNRDFWIGRRRHFALALDGRKRQGDALASNIGHLLWSGIVDDEGAEATVRRLFGDGLFTGWGFRTLSERAAGFNPLGYHVGAVWPHDTAVCAEGLRRYGFREEASRAACAVIEAAEAFAYRLPEVFAGFRRDATGITIEYPDAERPQAWAAAAPLLAIRTMLGMDAVDGKVRARPKLPDKAGGLRLRGVRVHG